MLLTFSVAWWESPLIWQGDEVHRATRLGRADRPDASVTPIEVLDDPRASYAVGLTQAARGSCMFEAFCAALHPVLVAFPTTLPDGSPLVRGIDDVLELRTVVYGRKAILTFNLGHLDVKTVDDLKID